jgi:hypothetical protein
MSDDDLAVVVVTFNSVGALPALVSSLTAQLEPRDELVVVDNASADGSAGLARSLGVNVIETGANLGFAAGCRTGADATSAPLIFFLNPDSVVAPGAIARLRAVAHEKPQWAAWQPAVMLPDGRINSAGGVVHYLGMGWAGQCWSSASELAELPYEAAFPSGAAMVLRREAWRELGGMREDYFLYGEDLDLGLRLWLAGRRVGVEPRARVIHDYRFERGARKWFLLERNRWRTLLTTYPPGLLAALAPALLAAELGLLALAAREGWLTAKLRAQLATLTGLPRALAHRRAVQRTRRIGSAQFAAHLTGAFEHRGVALPAPLAGAGARYWRLTRRLLGSTRVADACR